MTSFDLQYESFPYCSIRLPIDHQRFWSEKLTIEIQGTKKATDSQL